MRKIVTIVGARPQFIKAAPVSRVLRNYFNEILVHTGQHYDHNMSGIFFEELQIPKPDYNLEIGSGTHGKQTGEMLIKIEEILLKEIPDAVIVYGDTNSTLAGAIAASKLHIPVFHVEAGLRSFNKKMPEEINRILTDHVSMLLFAPTLTAVNNLKKENIKAKVIHVGDVMYDAILYNMQIAQNRYDLSTFGVEKKNYYLVTIHRAENTDDPNRLERIIKALMELDETIIFPLHPRTEKKLREYQLINLLQKADHIRLFPPVSYLEMLFLELNAKGILTDSGGVQKEAYFVQVPCFTLRDETEWVETVEIGWNTLINPHTMSLKNVIKNYKTTNYVEGLYGDGHASKKIVEEIKQFFEERS